MFWLYADILPVRGHTTRYAATRNVWFIIGIVLLSLCTCVIPVLSLGYTDQTHAHPYTLYSGKPTSIHLSHSYTLPSRCPSSPAAITPSQWRRVQATCHFVTI
ncbi:hypothetical protein K439DRAFT_545148 [Ramaria rubella]|nr:hypothetical protein K439DRAFT_545148 [Ramaria rubella]